MPDNDDGPSFELSVENTVSGKDPEAMLARVAERLEGGNEELA